jgi:hypothetical protein
MEFYGAMLQAQLDQGWNAVGLNAVHCAISAMDAVLVLRAGIRSKSMDHRAAVTLLVTHLGKEKSAEACRHFEALLHKKNLIEYESRECLQAEAMELMKHAERFYRWANSQLDQ